MIVARFPDHSQPARLVEACLIVAGLASAPEDADERAAFRALADELGDGLDRLPAPRTTGAKADPTSDEAAAPSVDERPLPEQLLDTAFLIRRGSTMPPPSPHRRTPTCDKCGEPIIWAITDSGARQPLNPDPNPAGSVLAYKDALTVWRARSLKSAGGDDAPRHPLERVYMPHFATCTGPRQLAMPENVTPLRRRGNRGRR